MDRIADYSAAIPPACKESELFTESSGTPVGFGGPTIVLCFCPSFVQNHLGCDYFEYSRGPAVLTYPRRVAAMCSSTVS